MLNINSFYYTQLVVLMQYLRQCVNDLYIPMLILDNGRSH